MNQVRHCPLQTERFSRFRRRRLMTAACRGFRVLQLNAAHEINHPRLFLNAFAGARLPSGCQLPST